MKEIIDEIFAFVATEEDGSEGVIASAMNGQWFPFVGADMARVKSLYPLAKMVEKETGRPFKILHFTSKKDITAEVERVCKL